MAAGNSTLRLIVYDTLETLKQTVKDRDIQPSQVTQWAIILMNRLKAQHIEKRPTSGMFMTTFTNVPVITPTATQTTGIVENRKYSELPHKTFDFANDAAVRYVGYVSDGSAGCPPEFTFVTFSRTTPAAARHLYADPYTKPSPSNPYFYITEGLMTFLGIEKVPTPAVEMGLNLPIGPVTEADLDAPLQFPEELLQILQRQLLDVGRFQLSVPADRKDDGSFDPESAIPAQKIASVNVNPEQ
jgi:hypothetical protein